MVAQMKLTVLLSIILVLLGIVLYVIVINSISMTASSRIIIAEVGSVAFGTGSIILLRSIKD